MKTFQDNSNSTVLLILILVTLGWASDLYAESVPVIISEIKPVPFVDEVEALGTLKANESVELMSTVTDRVIRVNFNDGQRATKGDVLIELDMTEEQAQLAEEQSRLNEALKQVKRLKPLAKKNATTQSTIDEQQREVETARARMNAIQSRIRERSIVAPFDGLLGLRNISVGAIAQPGTVITTIDDVSKMKLDFSIPELFLAAVSPGVKIEARSRAFKNQTFAGEVVSIDSRIDPITRSVVVRAMLDNPDATLLPGLLMRVNVQANPREALVIQEEALVSSSTKNYVYVVEKQDGKLIAKRVEVKLGERRKGEAEVLAGLSIGDKVVVHGVNRIRPGQEVSIKAIEENDETLQQMLDKKPSEKVSDVTSNTRTIAFQGKDV
ncbi:MAG: efflux RND transporter periplasmic adaptor subunit [Gammaproteobacteria bacterium]|nr:efflux RND transporter periplasmic adaptor subunit [Gammaproteobacteria bacterium]